MLRRRLATLAAAVLLALAFAAPTAAHDTTTGLYCSQADASFYGNTGFYPYQHNLYACPGSNVPYLTAVQSHSYLGDPATCRDWLGQDHGNFDNCISSMSVDFKAGAPAGLKLCVYVAENFSSSQGGLVIVGDWSSTNLAGAYHDKFSSYKWTTGSC